MYYDRTMTVSVMLYNQFIPDIEIYHRIVSSVSSVYHYETVPLTEFSTDDEIGLMHIGKV